MKKYDKNTFKSLLMVKMLILVTISSFTINTRVNCEL